MSEKYRALRDAMRIALRIREALDEKSRDWFVLWVPCIHCGAVPGERCKGATKECNLAHAERSVVVQVAIHDFEAHSFLKDIELGGLEGMLYELERNPLHLAMSAERMVRDFAEECAELGEKCASRAIQL